VPGKNPPISKSYCKNLEGNIMASAPGQLPQTSSTQITDLSDYAKQLLYGQQFAPGSVTLRRGAQDARLYEGMYGGNPEYTRQWAGLAPDADLAAYKSQLGTANPPATKEAPKEEAPKKAAEGGIMSLRGYKKGKGITADRADFLRTRQEEGKKLTPMQLKNLAAYDKAEAKRAAASPYTRAEADVGVVPFYDPKTMMSTNPYFLRAIEEIEKRKSWTDPGVSEQYMSPYIKNVIDEQKQQANRDFAQQQNLLRSNQVGMGAFGGSRGALMETEGQRNQNFLLDKIAREGLQSAYTQGMGQFNTGQNQLMEGAQGWGAAGQTLQGLGQDYYNTRQQNAKNYWGGATQAASPGVTMITGMPGSATTGQYTQTPSYWGAGKAEGGKV
jgi:hypothetical protein